MHYLKVIDFIKKSNFSPGIILDIGSNNGLQSIAFAKNFPLSNVYSFEPDQRALDKFKKKLLNQEEVSSRIKILKTCIGNQEGVVKFHSSSGSGKWENWDCSGSIKTPTHHKVIRPKITFSETSVPITTINSWSKGMGIRNIDFIWADIQGAELDMILGASDIFDTVKFINVECHDPPLYEGDARIEEIEKALKGFRLEIRTADDYFFVRNECSPL